MIVLKVICFISVLILTNIGIGFWFGYSIGYWQGRVDERDALDSEKDKEKSTV